MAVLMSYHKLVERDSKHVDYCWKCTTISILVLAAVCCITGSLSLQKLILAYNDHCILDADLKFTEKVQEEPKIMSSVAGNEAKTATLSEYFGATMARRMGSLDNKTYPMDELNFMGAYKIDDKETKWGKRSACDYAIFIPIFQFCFGIIITVMFIICGKGGKGEQSSFLPKPWRIVIPSLIFFLVMTCISIANLTNIQGGLDAFCKGLSDNTPEAGCLLSMNNFAMIENLAVLPSVLYILVMIFSWILLICWITLLSIMIARIIFVVDFQLVRVTIKTCEYDNTNERTSYKVVEPQEQDKFGKNYESINEC